jgi:hypothetical protein
MPCANLILPIDVIYEDIPDSELQVREEIAEYSIDGDDLDW